MNWTPLEKLEQIEAIASRSLQVPCLIFKHSTRCSISSVAKFRLESSWDLGEGELDPYLLDLISFREVSNKVADRFQVFHESPQAILVWKNEVLLDSSHLDISLDEIIEVLSFHSQPTN